MFGLFEDNPPFLIIEQDVNIGICDLNDVTCTSLQNNQVIVFNSSTGEWENAAQAGGGGGGRTYTGIAPITVNNDANQIGLNITPTTDWNGLFDGNDSTFYIDWVNSVNRLFSLLTLDDNSSFDDRYSQIDTNAETACSAGEVLFGDGTCGVAASDLNITDLGDVTILSVINYQILVFNSTTLQWENQNLDVNVLFVSTGFLTAFDSSDVNSQGILSIQHDANRQYPTVTVYDSNELILLPDDVLFIDNDNIDVNLLAQLPIVGTWHLRLEDGEVQDENTLFIRLDGGNDQSITAQIQFPVGILLPNTQSVSFSDSDLNISSTASNILNISSDGNVIIDANTIQFNRGCLKIEDTDKLGFTFCTTLNGVLSCGISPC